jgi:hypothetical protein
MATPLSAGDTPTDAPTTGDTPAATATPGPAGDTPTPAQTEPPTPTTPAPAGTPTPTSSTPEAPAPAEPAPAAAPAADGDEDSDDPDGGTPAENAEKWKAMARKHEKRARDNADSAGELTRLRAALSIAPPGTDLSTVDDLASRLRGNTPEELAEDARSLFGRLSPPVAAPAATPSGTTRPAENLSPGASSDAPKEATAAEIVSAVLKSGW